MQRSAPVLTGPNNVAPHVSPRDSPEVTRTRMVSCISPSMPPVHTASTHAKTVKVHIFHTLCLLRAKSICARLSANLKSHSLTHVSLHQETMSMRFAAGLDSAAE